MAGNTEEIAREGATVQEFLSRLMELAFSAEPPIEIVIRRDEGSVSQRRFTILFADLKDEPPDGLKLSE